MFPSVSPMNFRSNHVSTSLAKNYGAHVPKGFTVRIFKSPALSSLPSTAEPRFDVGYRPKTSTNTWQKPGWTSGPTKNEQQPRDMPPRASRAFGDTITSDLNVYRNDQPPNYSIYASIADDTYVYERSLCSKSDAYTETDMTSDMTASPSCLSTALSNDSTTTLHSTIITESPVDEQSTKTPSSTAFVAQHPFRVNFPGIGRTLSSSLSSRDTHIFGRPATPAPRARTSTSLGPRDSSLNSDARTHSSLHRLSISTPENSNHSHAPSTIRSSGDVEPPPYGSQIARNRMSSLYSAPARDNVDPVVTSRSSRDASHGQESRVSSMIANASFSDNFPSNAPPDISSASATRGSSPPHLSRSATPAPESRYRQGGYPPGQAVSEGRDPPTLRISTNREDLPSATQLRREANNLAASIGVLSATSTRDNRDDGAIRLQSAQRRNSDGDQGTHSRRSVYENEANVTTSSQRENSSMFIPSEQTTASSRTPSRNRSMSQSGFRESEAVTGERMTRPPSRFMDRPAQAELGFTSSRTRDVRDRSPDFIQQSTMPTSFPDTAMYDQQHRAPEARSPVEVQATRRTTPPMDGNSLLQTSRSVHSASTATGRTTPFPDLHRRELNGRIPSSASAIPSSSIDVSRQTSSRPRQDSDERARQHPSLHADMPEEDPFAYSGPVFTGESYRNSTPGPAPQGRDSERYQRRDSDEQRRRRSPTFQEDDYPVITGSDLGRRTTSRQNQNAIQRNRSPSAAEPQIILEGYGCPTFRANTPGGSRCVRWNPNLIAPSPVFASQRRKGWFNRRGDQLWTNDGSYKPPPAEEEYPLDLTDYPNYGEGWMNEAGVRIDMRHRLIPKPPLRSALKKT